MVSEIKIANVRNVSETTAKREILEYLDERERAYPSDIADDLELDYDLVRRVLRALKKSGETMPV